MSEQPPSTLNIEQHYGVSLDEAPEAAVLPIISHMVERHPHLPAGEFPTDCDRCALLMNEIKRQTQEDHGDGR